MARTYGKRLTADVEKMADLLTDPAKAAATLGGSPADWAEFHAAYAAKASAANPDVADQVREQVEAVFADMLRDNGQAVRKINQATIPGQRSAGYKRRAPGAKLDALFRDSGPNMLGDFVKATWHKGSNSGPAVDLREQLRVENAFTSADPGAGGFLVPESARNELMTLALEESVIRPRATVVPMDTLRVPFPAIDSTTNAGSVLGGVIAYWTEESAQLVDSQAKFDKVMLDAKKLTGTAIVPNELYQDALGALDAFIQTAFPSALAFYEDSAFLLGSGVGEPLGLLTAANGAMITVAKESGQAANTVLWLNVLNMYSRMLPSSLNRAVWLASPDTFPQLAQMALTVGTGGAPTWITDGASAAPLALLGRPIIFTEKVNKLSAGGDLVFVDPKYYLIGDRWTMTMESSAHARFLNDQTVIKFVERVDGRPWIASAITPKNGGPTLSPFVQLGPR